MPKSISIDPVNIRKSGTIKVSDIPANRYKPDFKKEEKLYGKDGLIGAFYDMLIIREFETMLDQIKKEGSYQGMEYNHKGPAHLSAGQESASVGQSLVLDTDDFIFGSHRSHGEILSKCFSGY